MSNPNLPLTAPIAPDHCACCPTAQGIQYGHDPLAAEVLLDPAWVQEELDLGSQMYCPWRGANCVCYPAELEWAQSWHEQGLVPPVYVNDIYLQEGC